LVSLSSWFEIENYVIWNWKMSEIGKDVSIQRLVFPFSNAGYLARIGLAFCYVCNGEECTGQVAVFEFLLGWQLS
jgi:hypothetical protein